MQAMRGRDEHAAAGTKRKADDSNLRDSDRFFKRFNLLSLTPAPKNDHANSNLYIPVVKPSTSTATSRAPSQAQDEVMQIDDTRDRVYIRDLDEELADIESDEEKIIFLPDIEKRLSRIPQQVLTKRRDEEHEGQELVLYRVPESLTADNGQDSVRRAILEARHRAREKAVEEARHHDMECKYNQKHQTQSIETAHGYGGGYEVEEGPDPDAMDMD